MVLSFPIHKRLELYIQDSIDEVFDQKPKFFCSLDLLREKSKQMQKNFVGNVAYAVKANPRPEVLKTLHQSGITYYDVASINEAKQVYSINVNLIVCASVDPVPVHV